MQSAAFKYMTADCVHIIIYIGVILKNMVDKERVKKIVEEWLLDKEYFLVDVEVTTDDRIVVEIDHKEGVWIEDCVELSRFIENGLDRDEEDFELEVGSAGLGQPFKVRRQYDIHVGDDVEVLTASGKKMTGTLAEAGDEGFTVVTLEKVKGEGEKRPHLEETEHRLAYDEVKWTKLHIDFK